MVDPLAALTAANRTLGKAAKQLIGCPPATCPQRWRDARAESHIGPLSPPVVIVHAVGDPTVPFDESVALTTALRAAGRPVRLVAVPVARHQTIGLPEVAAAVDRFVNEVTARRALG